MSRYTFDTINISHAYKMTLLGPLVGATLGFFIAVSKRPSMITIDTFYGAFLGLVFTVVYNLFLLSLGSKEEYRMEEIDENLSEDLTKIKRALVQLRELDQDRERLQKARIPDPNAPIYTRTRSRT